MTVRSFRMVPRWRIPSIWETRTLRAFPTWPSRQRVGTLDRNTSAPKPTIFHTTGSSRRRERVKKRRASNRVRLGRHTLPNPVQKNRLVRSVCRAVGQHGRGTQTTRLVFRRSVGGCRRRVIYQFSKDVIMSTKLMIANGRRRYYKDGVWYFRKNFLCKPGGSVENPSASLSTTIYQTPYETVYYDNGASV